ncbi:MAG: DUF1064 domain-containing protein [Bacteroidales bacterium]|nr:DUF1064 domain-containing protein [Bacteroidales bacterium]
MAKENRKVRGAVECEVDGVRVRSRSEREMYSLLKDAGFAFQYEPCSIELRPPFTAQHYVGGTLKTVHVKPVMYIPDFVVYGDGVRFLIDVKGFRTDWYLLKKKLLLEHVMTYNASSTTDELEFMEVSGKAQMRECVETLKRFCRTGPNPLLVKAIAEWMRK